MIGVAVLGSTGTIGEQTLDVIAQHPGRLRVVALGARSNVALMTAQCLQHRPDVAAMVDPQAARQLRASLQAMGVATTVLEGPQAMETLAALPGADHVMAAIVGAAGLASTLAAARAGKRILLANKEALVMAGPLLLRAVAQGGATLLPIDSEHNAIFQCLPTSNRCGEAPPGVRRILLTASGGPFRDWTLAQLAAATPAQAVSHPNWVMGRKISVDSATLMNKGLELIEACLLFGVTPEQVEVVVHRQSIVHSMVEYIDGSVLAQLGSPDMHTPIAHALAWPDRLTSGVQFLDLVRVGRLDFAAPDPSRFRCLPLAQAAARAGGLAPAVLNAANECAVQAFLDGRVNFLDIGMVIDSVMQQIATGPADSLEAVLAADEAARLCAAEQIACRATVLTGARA